MAILRFLVPGALTPNPLPIGVNSKGPLTLPLKLPLDSQLIPLGSPNLIPFREFLLGGYDSGVWINNHQALQILLKSF